MLLLNDRVNVAWRDRPFSGQLYRSALPQGLTCAEIIATVPNLDTRRFLEVGTVCVNGEVVPREMWAYVRPKSHKDIIVTLHMPIRGGGGGGGGFKDVIRIVAAIAILVVATAVSAGAAAGVLGASFGAGTLGATVLAGAISVGGALLLGAFVKPPAAAIEEETAADEETGGSAALQGNQLKRGGSIPRVVGTHRAFPPFLAQPLVDLDDDYNEVIEGVYGFAGPHRLRDIKFGDVFADDIDPDQLEYQAYELSADDGGIDDLVQIYLPLTGTQDSVNFDDQSLHDRTITASSTTIFIDQREGFIGNSAAYFPTSTVHLDTPPDASLVLGTQDFTVEMWFEADGNVGNLAALCGQRDGGSLGNDAFTDALLPFDGTDGSTTITDTNIGGSPHIWTANGNAQIDTAQSKFGGASLLCDGTGDYVTTPDSTDFTLGSGDWTADCWFNRNGGDGTVRFICGQCDSARTTTTRTFNLLLEAGNRVRAEVFVGGTTFAVQGTTAFTVTGWHHAAIVRTGNTLKLFVDGVQEGGDVAITGTVNNSANAFSVGREGEATALTWFGWIDEFRLSVGLARWTGNFTPPTQAYGIAATNTSFSVYRLSSGVIEFRVSDGVAFIDCFTTTNVSTGVHHFRGVRSGNTLMVFTDGVLQATTAFSGTIPSSNLALSVGTQAGNVSVGGWVGWIGGFRFTVGRAESTANFALPQIPYQPTEPTLITRYGKTAGLNITLNEHRIANDQATQGTRDNLSNQTVPARSTPQPQSVVARGVGFDEVWVTLTLPAGLFYTDDGFDRNWFNAVPIRVRVRSLGTTTWFNCPEVHIHDRRTAAFSRMITFRWDSEIALPGGVADVVPLPRKAWRAAYTTVPTQTVPPIGIGGWAADSHFYAGSGDTYLTNENFSNSGVRNVRLTTERCEFFLDGLLEKGPIEIEVRRGQPYIADEFTYSTYSLNTDPPSDALADGVFDFFGWATLSGVNQVLILKKSNASDEIVISRVATVWNKPPIARASEFAAIYVKVTGRSLDALSVLASGLVKDWDGTAWTGQHATSNPAPHYRDVLTGALNDNRIPESLVDDTVLLEWRQRCADLGFECNAVFSSEQVDRVLEVIGSCGYARPRQSEVWDVAQDRDFTSIPPVQMFSPRNFKNFRWEKAFIRHRPDGLRVRYNESTDNYVEHTIVVPRADVINAFPGRLEEIRYDGLVTEAEAVFKAVYDQQQVIDRFAFYYGETDVENLVCRRGDLVVVQHDILDQFAGYSRVLEVDIDGGVVNSIRLDGTVSPVDAFFTDDVLEGNDEFTVVLLPFSGAAGTTEFVDTAAGISPANAWTPHGGATVNGSAGITFAPSPSQYLSTPDNSLLEFGTQDFTIDYFFDANIPTGGNFAFAISKVTNPSGGAPTRVFDFGRIIGDVMRFVLSDGVSLFTINGTTVFNETTNRGFHHAAAVRTGNILRMFIDGEQEGGDVAFTGSVNDLAADLVVGTREGGDNFWVGTLRQMRVSIGVARWTTDFDPPTLPYGEGDTPFFTTPTDFFSNNVGAAIRLKDGTLTTFEAELSDNGFTMTPMPQLAGMDSSVLERECLVTTGRLLRANRRMLVFDIKPRSDLSAEITFVDEAPQLWQFPEPQEVEDAFMRNKIINGDMRLDQRQEGAVHTLTDQTTVYTLDRWWAFNGDSVAAAVAFNVRQMDDDDPALGFSHYLRVTVTDDVPAPLPTGDRYFIGYFTPYGDVADLNWGTANGRSVSLSMMVRASVAGTYTGSICNAASTESYVFTVSIPLADTWVRRVITIPAPPNGTDWSEGATGSGLQLRFSLGLGSTFTTTEVNTWLTSSVRGLTDAVDLVSTLGATFDITGVQFEAGAATVFEWLPLSMVKELAYPYTQVIEPGGSGSCVIGTAFAATTTAFRASVPLPVPLRQVPPVGVTIDNSPSKFDVLRQTPVGVLVESLAILSPDQSTRANIGLDGTVASGLTAGEALLLRIFEGRMVIDAELY